MKKFLLAFSVLILLFSVGCSKDSVESDSSSIISLPTIHTEQTANGYRNPALAVSSNVSNSNPSKVQGTNSVASNSTRYIASKNSTVFHMVDCSSAKRIKEENIIIFEDFEEASLDGFSPCSYCLKDK